MERIKVTAEEFQENLEEIVDDCSENGTIYEIEHEGNRYVLLPYDEEYYDLIKDTEDESLCT